MKYLTVKEFGKLWGVPERTLRSFCTHGRIRGAFKHGKSWQIPEGTTLEPRMDSPEDEVKRRQLTLHQIMKRIYKPEEKQETERRNVVLEELKKLKGMRENDNIYSYTQVEMTFQSNRIRGNMLSYEQVKQLFESQTIGPLAEQIHMDDVTETTNHFRCVDLVIEMVKIPLNMYLLNELKLILSTEIHLKRTKSFLKDLPSGLEEILEHYHLKEKKHLRDILILISKIQFLVPFGENTGQIMRLILLKECLANNIVPAILKAKEHDDFTTKLNMWSLGLSTEGPQLGIAQNRYSSVLNLFQPNWKKMG